MINVWDKTTQISGDVVAELLKSQFSIDIKEKQLLGEGFDNTAYLINNEWVFRFPHRAQALICMENEILILPYLAKKLSFSLSSPTLIGHACAGYPYPFAGYKILSGELLSKFQVPLVDNVVFAKKLGSWLQELHDLPVLNEHVEQLKGEHQWRLDVENRTQRVQEFMTQYAQYFTLHGFDCDKLITIMHNFKNLNTQCRQKCYLHGDLYAKHIIVDQAGLPSGLIDWGDVHIGHPGIDIAVGIMIFTEQCLKSFLQAYQKIDSTTLEVAIFKAYYHSILAFAYFAHIKEMTTLAWTKSALTNAIHAGIKLGLWK